MGEAEAGAYILVVRLAGRWGAETPCSFTYIHTYIHGMSQFGM
jgi:hypothetical protein